MTRCFGHTLKQHGGTDTFGRVLTTVFSNAAGEKLQFVESGLLVFEPDNDRYYFAPLGVTFNLGEPPEPITPQSGDLIINNFRVHPALTGYYLDLGRDLVGAPITNPHYNFGKNRLEQHFENLGLYYLLDDPEKTPHLLAYGLLACSSCQVNPPPDPFTVVTSFNDRAVINFIQNRNIPLDLLGDFIDGPVLLPDGTTEMVFENMALAARDGQIFIENVPGALGLSPSQLYDQITNPLLIFIPMQENRGHNVFILFHRFILANGGYGIAGPPTSELYTHDDETGVIRQCFANLCLDYDSKALEAQVRPARLGEDFLKQLIGPPKPTPYPTTIPSTTPRSPFTLKVWESESAINSITPQTISAMVFSQGIAQAGQNLELYLTLPEGVQQLYYLPTTNSDGRTGNHHPAYRR